MLSSSIPEGKLGFFTDPKPLNSGISEEGLASIVEVEMVGGGVNGGGVAMLVVVDGDLNAFTEEAGVLFFFGLIDLARSAVEI